MQEMQRLEGVHGEEIILASSLGSTAYFSIQTRFMHLILRDSVLDWLEEDDRGEAGPSAGRHGWPTDAEFDYFTIGQCLTTVGFDPVTGSWCPVLVTWICRADERHFRPHFRHLFQSIRDAAGSRFESKLLFNVSYRFLSLIEIYSYSP